MIVYNGRRMSDTFDEMRAMQESRMAELKMKLETIPQDELQKEFEAAGYHEQDIEAALGIFDNPPALDAIETNREIYRDQPEALLQALVSVIERSIARTDLPKKEVPEALSQRLAERIVEAISQDV